jgi:hypothetical protein
MRHTQGCCEAYSNAAKRFAPVAGVDAFGSGFSPKENLERIAQAIEHKNRIAHYQIELLVKAVKREKIILRFPREKK